MTHKFAVEKLESAMGHLGREGNATLSDAQAVDILITAQEKLVMGKRYAPYQGAYTAENFWRIEHGQKPEVKGPGNKEGSRRI